MSLKTTPLYVIQKGAEAEEAWLRAHGFDGLCAFECGCFIGDLYPCGERGGKFDCIAGHEIGAGIYRNTAAFVRANE